MSRELLSVARRLTLMAETGLAGAGAVAGPRPVSGSKRLEERMTPATLLTGFTETTVATGLNLATTMEFAPDGRLFVLKQEGNVELVRNDGTTWTALHLNVDTQGERGPLGIAFDPNYSTNHYVYLYYTNPNPGAAPWAAGEHNQLSRFTVNDANLHTNEYPTRCLWTVILHLWIPLLRPRPVAARCTRR
jgi:glucose/arabinose dehydrogenase